MRNLITIDVPRDIADEVRRFAVFLIADQTNRLSRAAVPDDAFRTTRYGLTNH